MIENLINYSYTVA